MKDLTKGVCPKYQNSKREIRSENIAENKPYSCCKQRPGERQKSHSRYEWHPKLKRRFSR